ncbi:hypothetical protein [Terrisporobacter mayombei]|uniref:Uncharacterized protein n=1 Tax=Terrisporobacter mayombei TaxID=1541 RepID=A0ABY9Q471_9FIRM|nr:hypothetical protein [Terrisporobacter mayombei]MCC3867127.1 hypothetical protein [Terrisporobacter mayombei]WMT81387.1 hypothetical protein TEMA_17270 [Terrisporobacter mayombei]
MKSRLLKDILAYIVVPVLLFNATLISNIVVAFQVSCAIAIVYSVYTRIKEIRVNFTGLVIFFIIIAYFLSSKNPDLDDVYFYNTCIFLSLALIIPGLKVFNKDISIIVLKDILKSLNRNSLAMIRLLKKKSMLVEVNKICSMIETNLILVSLLRIINILIYRGGSNSYLNFITNCAGVIFTVFIIYKIIKVVCESKKLNINKNNKGISNEDNTKGKVINFNSFK